MNIPGGYIARYGTTLGAVCVILAASSCAPSPHDLAGRGDVETLRQRIEEQAELVDARNAMEKTPLHYAVTYGHEGAVESLIALGADVDARDITGMTPLHVAATLDRIEEAEVLLAAGANLDARDEFGDTPLHSAAIHGKTRILNLLIESGAKPRLVNRAGLTAGAVARQHRQERVTERLD